MAGSSVRPLPFRRILITGADGFVGRHLVRVVEDRLDAGSTMMLTSRSVSDRDQARRIAFDLTDPARIRAAIRDVGPDLVIHLAAQASVGNSLRRATHTWSINLCGTLALAEAISSITPSCTMLHVSSAEVYGLSFNDGVVTEKSFLRPQSPYARSKAATEAMLADVLPETARLIVARPSNHSGPGQDERFVIPAFAAQIARVEQGLATEIKVGNLHPARDFLDVRDVVAAYVELLLNSRTLPSRSVYNIASGHAVTIGDILAGLAAMSLSHVRIVEDEAKARRVDIPATNIDNQSLINMTDWQSRISLEQTLFDVLSEQRLKVAGEMSHPDRAGCASSR